MKILRKPEAPEAFYIGYLPKAPAEYRNFVRLVVFAILVVMYFTIIIVVTNQQKFSTGIFERNKLTELEGVLMLQPFPAIKTLYGKDLYGNPVVKTIPLVNYGKFGAEPVINSVVANNTSDLNKLWIKVRGKLIYNKGITILELSEKEKSVLEVKTASKNQLDGIATSKIKDHGGSTFYGQIIDPKCYFGVMKPGEGKPHSDCAIRCIAGGIQPMLMIRNEKGQETFFILLDTSGMPVNSRVLSYVGMPVEVSGKITKVDDWLILKTDPSSGIKIIR